MLNAAVSVSVSVNGKGCLLVCDASYDYMELKTALFEISKLIALSEDQSKAAEEAKQKADAESAEPNAAPVDPQNPVVECPEPTPES